MNLKRYTVNCYAEAEVTFEVDHDILNENTLELVNSFWSGAESRIQSCGSVLNAVLCLLTNEIMPLYLYRDLTVEGVITAFDPNRENIRYFLSLNGEQGIKLINIETELFKDCTDFKIICDSDLDS